MPGYYDVLVSGIQSLINRSKTPDEVLDAIAKPYQDGVEEITGKLTAPTADGRTGDRPHPAGKGPPCTSPSAGRTARRRSATSGAAEAAPRRLAPRYWLYLVPGAVLFVAGHRRAVGR